MKAIQSKEVDIEFVWDHDLDPDNSWMNTRELEQYASGQIQVLVLSLTVDGEWVDSLGGITVTRSMRGMRDRAHYEKQMLKENGIKLCK